MRITTILLLLLLYTQASSAQDDKAQRKSPPIVLTDSIESVQITIDYSSPAVRGRRLWGALVPYGEVWRTGANEATVITFSEDAIVEGQEIDSGSYALFTIPTDSTWTLILNSEIDQWGAYDYSESKDVMRVAVKPITANGHTERMSLVVADDCVELRWGDLLLPIRISPKKKTNILDTEH